jgi:hypothetical protein
MIKRVWLEHGTKVLGLVGGSLGVIAGINGLIPTAWLPKIMALIGLLTFWRGFINTQFLNNPPDSSGT